MLKGSSSQLTASGRGMRKDSVICRGWPLGVCPRCNKYMGNTNCTSWVFFFFIAGVGAQGWEVGPGRNGKWVWSGCIVWNSQIINRNVMLGTQTDLISIYGFVSVELSGARGALSAGLICISLMASKYFSCLLPSYPPFVNSVRHLPTYWMNDCCQHFWFFIYSGY